MLHSISPAAFIAPEILHTEGTCPNCTTQKLICEGVVGNLHYYRKTDNAIVQALVWVCSPMCILAFEAKQYMGRC